jgi:ABC-2 type transport system ATP-binding protein
VAGTIIRTTGLTRDFASTRALDRLTFEVPQGIIFGFLGPNGSGKTTTIRILLGLLEPTDGQAEVMGFNTRSDAHRIRAQSGALLEHHGLYERLSAQDNLEFYGRIAGMPAAKRHSRIQEVLELFGLWERRKDASGSWSRGMKQKLAVARAMLHHPQIIFLDEPTAGMDPVAAAGFRDELVRIVAREGVTVFLTTHNLNEAEKICSRVAVIRQGKLLAFGPPAELRAQRGGRTTEIAGRGLTADVLAAMRTRPEVRRASLDGGKLGVELAEGAEIASLIPLLIAAGVQIEEIVKGKASLEDVFLKLVDEDQRSDDNHVMVENQAP